MKLMNNTNRILCLICILVSFASCDNNDLESKTDFINVSRIDIPGNSITDVWGYEYGGKEYAIVGDESFDFPFGSVSIVDVTVPSDPVIVSTTPLSGFDMKIWDHYLYVGDGHPKSKGDEGGKILDIIDPSNPIVVGSFPSCHNLFIDDQGFMYLAGGLDYVDSALVLDSGLRIYDLKGNPAMPKRIWSGRDDNPLTHDISVIGNRLYLFEGKRGTSIYDITNRESPILLSTINDDAIKTYDHSGWVTEDGNYLFICNELSNSKNIISSSEGGNTIWDGVDISIYDISNPYHPDFVGAIHDDNSRVHNLYIVENFAYVSYYDAGLRIYDISNPQSPLLYYEFDTNEQGGAGMGDGFLGAFGVYPFTTSKNIYVSDIDNGLYVFSKKIR